MPFFEISALRGINITESRDALIQFAYNYKKEINMNEDIFEKSSSEKDKSQTTNNSDSTRSSLKDLKRRSTKLARKNGKCCK